MAACEKLDPSLEEAAASLGAPWWMVIKDVIIPALAPALISTGAICFATSMGAFGTIFALGTSLQVLPLSIYSEFVAYSNFAMAAALSILLGLITWLTLLLTQRFTGLNNSGGAA
ncbi:Inner membrane ABC transporter permease protein ycjO [Oligella ureolytica]|nr:Inner membrane ABC transporter permease protein ycjO [Oligella ureolytica]